MDIAAKEFGNPWKPFQSNEPRVLASLAKIGFSNFCLSALSEWHQNLFPFFIAFKPITDGKEGKEDLDLKGGSFLSKAHCTRGLNELILIYWTINAQFCLFWMGNRKPRASLQRCHKIYLKPSLFFRSLIPSIFAEEFLE